MDIAVDQDPAALLAALGSGQPGLRWRRVVADLDTPLSAYLKLTGDRPGSFLLESVEGGEHLGRYSIIATDPDLSWEADAAGCRLAGESATPDLRAALEIPDALLSLRRLRAASRIAMPEGLPPMAAGLFGYLGYDIVRRIEKLPDDNPDTLGVPEALLCRPRLIAVFDNLRRDLTLVAPFYGPFPAQAKTVLEALDARLQAAVMRLTGAVPLRATQRPAASLQPPRSNMTRGQYLEAVRRAIAYTHAGDIFQVVPSQRFTTEFTLPAFELYRALRRLNPSPFLFHLNFAGFQAVGSSPEILVRVRDRRITLRPIAGTRPRGADADDDARLAEELLADPKELSEHLMLLDLGRNDVGRVATIGSVAVTQQMVIERYSHVMHIVSQVEGDLSPELDELDALLAGFPAGTVSGAPKIRAMEIIDELEPVRRGLYAGCVGYFGADGAIDSCIALRTGLVREGKLHVQAGGGVVADSDPELEFQETVNKARALFRAAEEAYRIAGSAAL